jgi:hypothetical protein
MLPALPADGERSIRQSHATPTVTPATHSVSCAGLARASMMRFSK